MATATLSNVLAKFPATTSVGAYPLSGEKQRAVPPTGTAPQGSATVSATVDANGALAFTGLADGTIYAAGASVSGEWRYVQFRSSGGETSHNELQANKDVPNGYPGLNSSGYVPSTDLVPNVVNVKDPLYGATGDGTTDDTAAIQAAINAVAGNGDVLFPAGTYLLNSLTAVALKLPAAAAGLRIRGAGVGATTIKLSTNTPTAFLPNRTGDGLTFQKIDFADFTVDCNSITGAHSVVFGTLQSGGWSVYGKRCHFQNINFRRIKTVNVPTGDYSDVGHSYSRQNISIQATAVNSNEATQYVLQDILVEDCDFTGGGNVGVAIGGTGGPAVATTTTTGTNTAGATSLTVTDSTGFVAGELVNIDTGELNEQRIINTVPDGTHITVTVAISNTHAAAATVRQGTQVNILTDRVTINRLRHDTGIAPDSLTTGSYAHVQLGGAGKGGTCDLIGVNGKRSGDVGIEIDAFQVAHLERCRVEDAKASAYLAKNFQVPTDQLTQQYVYDQCVAVLTASITPGSTTSGWNIAYAQNPNPMMGSVVLSKCRFHSANADYSHAGQAISCASGPVKRITVSDFDMHADGISYTNASGATIPVWIQLKPDANAAVTVRNALVRTSGAVTVTSGSVSPQFLQVSGVNGNLVSFLVDGFKVSGAVTGVTNGGTHAIELGSTSGSSLMTGTVRGFQYVKWATGDNAPKAVVVNGTASLGIQKQIAIVNNQFENYTGEGFDVSFAGTSNAAKTILRDNTYRVATDTLARASTATLTVPNAPWVQVTGTADITSVAAGLPGSVVTLQFTGTAAATGVTDGSNLKLNGNFAYTPDDCLTLVCDGTSWFEVGRSAN
jgi:hypothetical protein